MSYEEEDTCHSTLGMRLSTFACLFIYLYICDVHSLCTRTHARTRPARLRLLLLMCSLCVTRVHALHACERERAQTRTCKHSNGRPQAIFRNGCLSSLLLP